MAAMKVVFMECEEALRRTERDRGVTLHVYHVTAKNGARENRTVSSLELPEFQSQMRREGARIVFCGSYRNGQEIARGDM